MDDMVKCMRKVLQINIPRHLVPLSSKERFGIFQLIVFILSVLFTPAILVGIVAS